MTNCRFFSFVPVAALVLTHGFQSPAQTSGASTDVAPPAAIQSAPVPPSALPNLNLNLSLSGSSREVMKLVSGGISADVVKAYIDNSASAFNLTADGIIRLQNAGVPNNLITAMMAHDKEMRDKGQMAVLPPPAPPSQYPSPDQAGGMTPPMPSPDYGYDTQTQTAQPADYGDLSPYGSWYYDPPLGEWYWSPYPSLWNYGYPWGIGALNHGRWWYHNNHGWVWSHGAGNRGGRTYYSTPPYRGGGTQGFGRQSFGGVHATVVQSGFSRLGGGGGSFGRSSVGGGSAGGHGSFGGHR